MIKFIKLDGDFVLAIGTSVVLPEDCIEVDLNFELSESPSSAYSFNWSTQAWEDKRGLDTVKAEKVLAVNRWRAAANESYFTYQGKQIACDKLSRSDIDAVNAEMALTNSFPAGWPGGWKCMDNTYVAINDKATWITFLQAMTAQGTANFMHAQALKMAIAAATTVAEVEAVVW